MKLQKLEIEFNRWGENAGKYTGKIAYEGKDGSVQLLLSPEISNDLLRHIGKNILQFSAVTARQLEQSIEASVTAAEKEPYATGDRENNLRILLPSFPSWTNMTTKSVTDKPD